jgi:uncharacterized hydrophobic protein (TIGR00271 family)
MINDMAIHLRGLFRIARDQETFQRIRKDIEENIRFSGRNLWILILAILIASFGLNVNSSAVIIGAMLISPLMGPIMGIGLGASINDIALLKRSAQNFLFATSFSLLTSTLYFLFTPLDDAHSELLARTSPNIYDVFIALAGGFAGIIAISGNNRGNVLPGVAIATALMPPLCTAGYGLATLQWKFLFGAFYLFIINGVFIALSTYLFARFIRFPLVHDRDKQKDRRQQRLIWALTLTTLIPSVFFSYQMLRGNQFRQNANRFIEQEIVRNGAIVLSKEINAGNREIKLYLAGTRINKTPNEFAELLSKFYALPNVKLDLQQGQNLHDIRHSLNDLQQKFEQKNSQDVYIRYKLDSIQDHNAQIQKIADELPLLFNGIIGVFRGREHEILILTDKKIKIENMDSVKLKSWLSLRLSQDSIKLILAK